MRYRCTICGEIYDDDKEAVPFTELPDDWRCPVCGAVKDDFEPIRDDDDDIHAARAELIEELKENPDAMYNLSKGQLAALCSNLARGCEKQYKFKEQKMFMELAAYFEAITPAVNDAKVQDVSEKLMSDLNDTYPIANYVGDADSDRGALRICVWGEKVTRMLDSLVNRYLKEGEKLLEGQEIWVCTVCGFVYIGENPPEICPVCKVPSWKFKKIEKEARA